jgi:hypothetical protein
MPLCVSVTFRSVILPLTSSAPVLAENPVRPTTDLDRTCNILH